LVIADRHRERERERERESAHAITAWSVLVVTYEVILCIQ